MVSVNLTESISPIKTLNPVFFFYLDSLSYNPKSCQFPINLVHHCSRKQTFREVYEGLLCVDNHKFEQSEMSPNTD